MPLHRLLHIALCLLLLLAAFGACTEEEVVTVAPTRTLTVDLGITLTRAAQGTSIGDGSQPHDLQLWIFDQSDNLLDYAEITDANDLFFSGSDALGELVNTIQRIVEVESTVTALNVYVVLNGISSGLSLGETSMPADITEATFSLPTGDQTWTSDNTVPIYGEAELDDIDGYQKEYSLTVEAKRAVGKLELLFTKDSEDGYLKITNIKLEQIPDKTYLKEQIPVPTDINYTGSEENIMKQTDGIEIRTTLPSDVLLGNFSQYETTHFTPISLSSAYWLENTKGSLWSETDNSHDYTYPYGEDAQVEDKGERYKMTVTYRTLVNGPAKEQVIYLPKMERNTWTKIFARVKGEEFTIEARVLPWNKVESSIGWDPVIDDEGNAPMAAWRMVDVENVPEGTKGSQMIDPDFKDATKGDEEAACCYVMYPRYGRTNGASDHDKLEDKPSYAAFYFCLKEPAGAIWEAYLTNTEDFEFATGDYDIDGDGNTDRRCATTGIAREAPYQIQVTAKNAWTTPEHKDDEEFWNNETPWGEQVEASGEQYDIHTDLYIRISTDGGYSWHYLDINKEDDYIEHSNWKEQRRFAGEDNFIRIWQLKATEGKAFDDLVDELDNSWAIKGYWQNNYSF